MAILTVLNNPFDPKDKTVKPIDGGLAIFLYLDETPEDIEYIISINGKITEDYSYILRQDDSLAIVPVPKGGGGGGGKQILSTIAMIALTIAAPQIGLAALNYIGAGTALSYGGAMAVMYGTQIAVMVGGGLLMNALMPTPNISSNTSTSLEEVSPTYSFSGGSNAREQGSTLPIMIGEARVTPPIIGSYLSLSGDKQYLNILMAVNDGEVDSITDIELNDQSSDNFENVSYETRLGTNDQSVISGFRDSSTTVYLSRGLNEQNIDTVYTTAGNAIQEIEVVINLSSGHFKITDAGSYILPSNPISFKIEYKKTSDTIYTDFKTVTLNQVYKTTQRLAYPIENLDADEYDVRVTRLSAYSTDTRTANNLVLDFVNEVVYDDFIYPNVSLLSVKAMATDQLEGSFPVVTCLVNNTLTRDTLKPLSNPAWGCYELLKRENIPDSDINLVKFQEWADYCDFQNFTCNLYLDSQQELQSALNMISILGRATVVQMGNVFVPIVSNVVDMPTQKFLFTGGNIVDSSFSLDYIPYNDRANTIEVTYYDKDDGYSAKTVQVQSDDFDTSSAEISSSIILYGCTDRNIALRYAQFLLNQNRYISETVTFEADVDSIACTVGDVVNVGVQYMTNTLAEGRIVSATTNSITLDTEIDMSIGEYYELQYRTANDEIHTLDVVGATDGITDTIITNTLAAIPEKYDVFAFGLFSTEATNSYRVTSITRASDQKRKITAVEYNASVYDDFTTVQIEEVSGVDGVDSLEAETFLIKDQDSYQVGLNLSWIGNRLTYPIYYKKSNDGDYSYYGNSSNTNETITGLVYGQEYDIKVLDKEVTIIFEDTSIPAKVDTFTVTGTSKQMKTLSFSLLNKPIDFKGYEIRYQIGDYPFWDTATPLHDGVLTVSPFSTNLLGTKGTYTIMIKAIDIFGNESNETSNILFSQAFSLYDNLVFTEDFALEGFTGTKTNCTVIDDNLEATTPNGDGTWTMEYIDVFYPDIGETAKIIYEGDGSPLIYYRSFGDLPFYDNPETIYLPSNDYIFREDSQNDWVLYSAGFKTTPYVPYQVKLEFIDSVDKPIVREFKVEVDAIDIIETQDDVTITSAGLRVYADNIDSVKWVGAVLQDTGTGARSVDYVKYTDGAFIKVYDIAGNATDGLVDILLKGYNNG